MEDSGGCRCILSIRVEDNAQEAEANRHSISIPDKKTGNEGKTRRRNRAGVFDVQVAVPEEKKQEWRRLERALGSSDPTYIISWLLNSTASAVEELLKKESGVAEGCSDIRVGRGGKRSGERIALETQSSQNMRYDYQGNADVAYGRNLTSRKVQKKMTDPDKDQTSINMLPDEVLADILVRVSKDTGNKALRFLEVCKHWDEIARTSIAKLELRYVSSVSLTVKRIAKFEWLRSILIEESKSGIHGWQPVVEVLSARFQHLTSMHIISVQPRLSTLDASVLLAGRTNLKALSLRSSLAAHEAPWLRDMSSLESLDLTDSLNLSTLPFLHNLSHLKTITLTACPKLSAAPGLDHLPQLETLHMDRCPSLASPLPQLLLANLSRLTTLSICSPKTDPESQEPTLPFPTTLQSLTLSSNMADPPRLSPLPLLRQFTFTNSRRTTDLPSLAGLAGPLLTSVTISHCHALTNITPLLALRTLQLLHVRSCSSLESLPCFDGLAELQTLSITSCHNITNLPPIQRHPHLTSLDLSSCRVLATAPVLWSLPSLQKILLSNCGSLKSLPPLNHLVSLRTIDLSLCTSLELLPDLSGLASLETLSLKSCVSLGNTPSLTALSSLKNLDASNVSKWAHSRAHPDGIFSAIESLTGLQSLSVSPVVPNPLPLSPLPLLHHLTFHDAPEIPHLPRLEGADLTSLLSLTIFECKSLTTMAPIGMLCSLQKLRIIKCNALLTIPDLSALTDLQELSVGWCRDLEEFPAVSGLRNLCSISIDGCSKLRRVPGLSALPSLHTLQFSDCGSLGGFPTLDDVPSLKKLCAVWCRALECLPALDKLFELEELRLRSCGVVRLPALSNLLKLRVLDVKHCTSLSELPLLDGLCSLEMIDVSLCSALKHMPPRMKWLPRLQELHVGHEVEVAVGADVDVHVKGARA